MATINPAAAQHIAQQNLSPAEGASHLLTLSEGVARNAEAYAWSQANLYPQDHDGRRFWVQVVRHIVFGGEFPVVDRKAPTFIA